MSAPKLPVGAKARVVNVWPGDPELGVNVGEIVTVLEDDPSPWCRLESPTNKGCDADGLCEMDHGWLAIGGQIELIA